MWNYSFVIPNIFILITFLVFYFTKPRLPVRLNKSFFRLLITEMFVIIIDVIASLHLENYQNYPVLFLTFENILFFTAFVLRSFFFYLFTRDGLKVSYEKNLFKQLLQGLVLILALCIILLNFKFDLIFKITEQGYSPAPLYKIIYTCGFYYVILSIFVTLVERKNIPLWSFSSSIAFNCVLFAGYTVRLIFPHFLLMDSFCLLAIIIIYSTFESPSIYLEGRTGNFNEKALFDVLKEREGSEAGLIIGFILHNYTELREMYSHQQIDEGIRLIGQYLTRLPDKHTSFYIRNGMFVILGANKNDGAELYNQIEKRFSSAWTISNGADILFEASFIKFEPNITIPDSELLLKTINSSLIKAEHSEAKLEIITLQSIENIKKNTKIKLTVEKEIESNHVDLYLQPLVSAKDFKLVGAEALSRLHDSSGAIIPPDVFIPIAETNGKINLLGEQIFEKTCQFIKENDLEKLGLSWINVNLSPLQFLRRDLSERFSQILDKYEISADKIHLEITESAMIDYAQLKKQIQQMQQNGFQFVLDDYGSGYSNMSRLKRCPFINIKLDMEIVWDHQETKDDILPTFIKTFKQMNFSVTAEGIETLEMAEEMKRIGCDYLQGYYFDKPLQAKDFVKKYMKN